MPAPTPRTTKRADAVRNVERILDAAIICLADKPTASMADIAKQAGLGRVTLYGHFASRAELLEAVVAQVLAKNEHALAAVDLTGNPRDALVRLIDSSWMLTNQARSIIAAAEDELPPARMQELHAGPAARVEALIERGRREGVFRTDMPTSWLVTVIHQILHGAAVEVSTARLDPRDASKRITATILAVLDKPDEMHGRH
ncbi:TetR/AcrR family transcriptional regulator [Rhodococcus chondri]|uniref:TetR/AcrR family transcriptional regulator n=1 Tax=Rhodococcus chondri TaxID=3065941 RepID=A0ABU7JMI1_9NOCA|nr:TetR/AcrR family transcriptional regulator [Rhodococcus sp. CC-R104]MEE2030922.1 TetR/AcrR family transcriptional regulator [Rhodococcus sp. CC-R104]